MSFEEGSVLLNGACRWIRENLSSARSREELAVIYVKGQDDLTCLRRAIEHHLQRELPDDDDVARAEISNILAKMSKDVVSIIDLTLDETSGYEMTGR